MRIGMMTGILLALLLPDGSDSALIFVTLAIGFFGGEALSSKLDAMARKGGEPDRG